MPQKDGLVFSADRLSDPISASGGTRIHMHQNKQDMLAGKS